MHCHYDIYKAPPKQNIEDDVGTPLILTPLIERGEIKEALEQALVTYAPLAGPNNITSYSGYFTVDKTYESNLFFWFFLSQDKPETDPVVLWLQGGPGSSSLNGVFTENGPYVVDENLTLSYREYSWTKNHSVLYIDNPAGTGFSYTADGGFADNETKVGEDLFQALTQFFELFPKLQDNEFYVTGESYGGHFIPAICHYIDEHNGDSKINLKGFAIGNPLTDARYQADYATYMYYLGLLNPTIADTAKTIHERFIEALDNGDYSTAIDLFNEIRDTVHLDANLPNVYNHQDLTIESDSFWVNYMVQTVIRKKVHIGNVTYGAQEADVHSHLKEDKVKSVGQWLADLIGKYRVLLFNGQLDTLDPYPLMVNLIRNLNFSGKDEYLKAQRKVWRVDGETAGYVKSTGNFSEVLVRDAGHMVPKNQPKRTYELIYKFIRNIPLLGV